MMLYKIVLVLAIFGAVTGIINETGFYPTVLPSSGAVGISQAQVTDMSGSAVNSPVNAFSAWSVLTMCLGVLFSTFQSVVLVSSILVAYGCPTGLAIGIQGIVWLVMAMGIYQMSTGHNTTNMD